MHKDANWDGIRTSSNSNLVGGHPNLDLLGRLGRLLKRPEQLGSLVEGGSSREELGTLRIVVLGCGGLGDGSGGGLLIGRSGWKENGGGEMVSQRLVASDQRRGYVPFLAASALSAAFLAF